MKYLAQYRMGTCLLIGLSAQFVLFQNHAVWAAENTANEFQISQTSLWGPPPPVQDAVEGPKLAPAPNRLPVPKTKQPSAKKAAPPVEPRVENSGLHAKILALTSKLGCPASLGHGGLNLSTEGHAGAYTEGESVKITIRTPGFPSYLYVDYFDNQ